MSRNFAQERVLRVLADFEPLSAVAIAALNGEASAKATKDQCNRMWDRKMLHIARYERGLSGLPAPLFAIGPMPDAPKLPRLTNAEKLAKYRATEKGKKADQRARKKRKAKNKKRRMSDPAWAERMRKYKREWFRVRHGVKNPRVGDLPNARRFDAVLAAMIGRNV